METAIHNLARPHQYQRAKAIIRQHQQPYLRYIQVRELRAQFPLGYQVYPANVRGEGGFHLEKVNTSTDSLFYPKSLDGIPVGDFVDFDIVD